MIHGVRGLFSVINQLGVGGHRNGRVLRHGNYGVLRKMVNSINKVIWEG